jgi:hypothetical protein
MWKSRLMRIGMAVGVLAAVSVSTNGGKKPRGFALSLVPSQNAVQPGVAVWKAGTNVFVIVQMTNDSNKTVHYSLMNSGYDYEMDVRDASGKPVPETERLRKLKESVQGPISGRNILVTLKPHESGQDTVELSSFFDLSSPGRYSIQVRREFPDVGKGLIESNRLEITLEQ